MNEIVEEHCKNSFHYTFTDSDFDLISKIAIEHFGLSLPAAKKSMVYSRVSRRLRELGYENFASYRELLLSADSGRERTELLSALTTNVTHFFREQHHFDFLREKILPDLVKKARAGGRVRIWSAGCSTGQEPYSIALTVAEACPDAGNLDLKILATDIDPKVVASAQRGHFDINELTTVPKDYVNKHFNRSKTSPEVLSICSSTKGLVSFGVLNLTRPFPFSGAFDVIFCRNVAIYFNKMTQEKVWEEISKFLPIGGNLFIGHSERLCGKAVKSLKPVGITSYEKSSSQ